MVGILRLVVIGLHRFTPPSDKAEFVHQLQLPEERYQWHLPLTPYVQCIFEYLN